MINEINKIKLNRLLMEQFGVLARIDLGSDIFLKNTYLKSTRDKRIKDNKLRALEMSKKMAYTCYIVMKHMKNEVSLEETLDVLTDCLATKHRHSYSVSASWNLNQIYNILANESTSTDHAS